MTTLELFKKHRQGEVSRERFLYEVRRDNNLPWVTNTTSYDDAVKILKNKGIIREAQFEPQNITTDPAVDRANPYAVKREVEKLLAKEKELTNDSYKIALNKAAKKIAGNPQAIKDAMFANADTVEKADAKLQTQEVKKNNFVDKDNGMKKMKGQETLKAMSAPTKENRKGKPKGVKVMPDKGVEGSQKIIKEISEYIKKKLAENSMFHEFHQSMEVETAKGPGKVKEINGGTVVVELEDGTLVHEQMNTLRHRMENRKEEEGQYPFSQSGMGLDPEEPEEEHLEVGSIVKYHGQMGEVAAMSKLSGMVEVIFDNGDRASIHKDDLRIVDVDEEDDMDYEEDDMDYEAAELQEYATSNDSEEDYKKNVDLIRDTIDASEILDAKFKDLAPTILDKFIELVELKDFSSAYKILKGFYNAIERRYKEEEHEQDFAYNFKTYFDEIKDFLKNRDELEEEITGFITGRDGRRRAVTAKNTTEFAAVAKNPDVISAEDAQGKRYKG